MTDREILNVVYHRLQDVEANWSEMTMDRMFDRWHDLKDLIEQEWQKRDEQEVVDQYNRNRSPKDWIVDVREMERHRGLEIGPDGTVVEVK